MRTVLSTLLLLLTLTLIGTIGFHFIAGRDLLDSLYLAVITLSTVGNRDPGDEPATQIFTIAYLVGGLGVFSYSATRVGVWIVSAEFQQLLRKRRMQKRIAGLNGHSVVCGLGRMGRTIARTLIARQRRFVIIDKDEQRLRDFCAGTDLLFVTGDATHDDTLKQAGIERAESLTTVLATDADNLYVVLSARMLNAGLKIIARATDDRAIQKLEHAGATRVVSPFTTGAEKMARFMLNPGIEDFIEIADGRGQGLELAEIQVSADNPWIGRSLKDTDLRHRGVMVIGIRRASGERLMPPSGDAVISSGDALFVFGTSEAVNGVLDHPA